MIPMTSPPGKFLIVPRAVWGAAPTRGDAVRHKPARIVVHHSHTPDTDQFSGDRTIRAIQRVHQDENGWADIAYHFLISPDGAYVYEGRPVQVIGAHCGGKVPPGGQRNFGNTGSIGICCIGNYDAETPAPQLLETLSELMQRLRRSHGIMPDQQFGHCEAAEPMPKSCPGKNLFLLAFGKRRFDAVFGGGM
jgi:hypothetical protein